MDKSPDTESDTFTVSPVRVLVRVIRTGEARIYEWSVHGHSYKHKHTCNSVAIKNLVKIVVKYLELIIGKLYSTSIAGNVSKLL